MAEPPAQSVIHTDYARVGADFRSLLEQAAPEELHRATAGTKWSNEELLFHMLLGYLIVLTLLPLVRLFSRLPSGVGTAYARLLDAATRPFDQVNFLGARVGSRLLNSRRMAAGMDRTLAALEQRYDRETPESLVHGMRFPTRWDPFFGDWMTIADLYSYPTQHYDFHREQLTLRNY